MTLPLDADELNTCVSCGLCLPHCPTYRATGEEALSPRGRIDAMRAVQWRGAPIDDDFVSFMATCVQCRGCEPACPSQVPYGRLVEGTRTHLANTGRITPWWQRLGFRVLPRHRMLLAGSSVLAVGQRMRLVPGRVGLAPIPVRRGPAVRPTAAPTGADAWLFTGCVMDAWMRGTHRSTGRVLDAMGVRYAVPGAGGGCCGALHTHAGLHGEAQLLAIRVMASMPGPAPVLVNSAGCGAALKEYGRLLGTDDAARFSARVFDVHEWIAGRLDDLPDLRRRDEPVIVQDPCHLRHVQRVHLSVRDVVGRFAEVVELDDDGLCCGAGGAYSALEPELAGQIRERKLAAIDRAVALVGPDGRECEPRLQHAPGGGADRAGHPSGAPGRSPRRGDPMTGFGELADRLDSIVADLDELVFDRLREAAADGMRERPQDDKELVKARRAVEKAAHVLRRLDQST